MNKNKRIDNPRIKTVKSFGTKAQVENVSMRSMQELFFSAKRVEMGNFVNIMFLIFVTEKEHNFQTDENIALLQLKRNKKPKLSELTQAFFFYLLSLLSKYFAAKKKCGISATLIDVSFVAVVWSLHPTLSIPRWKESALCDETK